MAKRTAPFIVLCAALIFCVGLVPAQAHYPWLTVSDEEPMRFVVGWGHDFPKDGILGADRIASATLVLPDGTVRELSLGTQDAHLVGAMAPSGLHILAAEQRPGFYSRTHQGGRAGSKIDHPGALSCSESANTMKALISRGEGGDPGRLLGHALEIVPLADPASLGVGDEFAVRILFQGKPFRGTVEATWAGFPDKESYAVTRETDASGEVRIPLSHGGLWLVKAATRVPYPDAAVCDHRSHTATLTFRIR